MSTREPVANVNEFKLYELCLICWWLLACGWPRVLSAAEPLSKPANVPLPPPPAATPVLPGYVGSSSCRECHSKFYQLWAPSRHGLAMQPYTFEFARTNLLEQKKEIKIGAYRYRAEIQKGRVLERGPGGGKGYGIEQVMGGKNVYYFLTSLERGRLQVLPVAFDVRRREWFDMAASAVRHFGTHSDAPLDWRESPLTFNTSCYNCHVSQLSKNYDLPSDSYHTTWAEPGINCETCHGPGAEHVAAARALPKGETLRDPKLIVTTSFSPEQMNSLCGSCHAKMFPLTASFTPGDQFFDHFSLIGLDHVDFYPDGRDLGEDFTYTSWRLSRCARSGKLDCMHCHTSSGRNRFEGDLANQACLPCHAPQVQNAADHSHHKAGTDGAKCISCHMPTTEFARMGRSDHSMRPPMPAATLACGSPNACNLCHSDKDATWADRFVRQWQTNDYQAATLDRTALVAAARKQDWSKLPAMVKYLAGAEREEIWAAGLIQLLRPCSDDAKWAGIRPCFKDPSPLVRAAAVDAAGDQLGPDVSAFLLAATRDPSRLVRIRAAAALASMPRDLLAGEDQRAFDRAAEELQASYQARPDDPASHYNLGNYYMERLDFPKAIEAFQHAIQLQPQSVPPLVNLSLAYSAVGQNDQAETALRQALSVEPTNAIANLNFGMLMAELDKPAEAERAFRTAFKSDPQSAAAAYNLGVLLAKEHPDEALVWCRRAVALRPQDLKYAYTLAYFLSQADKRPEAIAILEKAMGQGPGDADTYSLLGQLYEEAKNVRRAMTLYRKAATDPRLPETVRLQFELKARHLVAE